jgi:MFS family permease
MTSLVFSLLVLPRALDHLGSKGVLTVGMLLLAVGLTIFARVPVPSNYLLDILPASLIVAIGLPCAFAGTNIAAVTAVPNEETGLASGLMNTTQRVGSGIGIATLTAVLVARLGPLSGQTSPALLASGFQTGFLGAALFALLGAVLTLLIIRQTKQAHADVTGDVEGDKDLAPAGTRKFHFHH